MKYKLTFITDRDGTPKLQQYSDIEKNHSLYGYIYHLEHLKDVISNGGIGCLCFEYDDHSEKMMRTSRVESINHKDGKLEVITMNSVYMFEEVDNV